MYRNQRGARRARMSLAVLATGLLLASCSSSHSPEPVRSAGHAGKPAAAARAPARNLAPAVGTPSVWNVRAGLNVAALTCRSSAAIQRDYKRLLARHSALLKSSYAAAQRRDGGNFDRQQTKLYNRFAQHRSRARFCEAAEGVARDASTMESNRLAPEAPRLLARLEQGRR